MLVAAGLATEAGEDVAEKPIPFFFKPGTKSTSLGGNPRRSFASHLSFQLQIGGKPVLTDGSPARSHRITEREDKPQQKRESGGIIGPLGGGRENHAAARRVLRIGGNPKVRASVWHGIWGALDQQPHRKPRIGASDREPSDPRSCVCRPHSRSARKLPILRIGIAVLPRAKEVPIRTLNVSLVAVATVLASLALARQRHEERRSDTRPAPERAPAFRNINLDEIRNAGF